MHLTAFRTATYLADYGHPVGDANGVMPTPTLPTPVLELETDAGLVGTAVGGDPTVVARLWPWLDRRDPREVRSLRAVLEAAVFKSGATGAIAGTIAAVEHALWDLAAQAAELPLWRYLGASSPRIRVYASGLEAGLDDGEIAALYRRFAERGIRSAKLKVGREVARDIERLELVAQVIEDVTGGVEHLMVDLNEYLGPKHAIQATRALHARRPLLWVEEPAARDDPAGLRRVRDAVDPLVASGENLLHAAALLRLMDADAVDVVQCSGSVAVTDALTIQHVAELRHQLTSVVSTEGHTLAHVVCLSRASLPYELKLLDGPGFLDVDHRVDDGDLVLAATPGVGYRVNAHAVEHAAPSAVVGEPPRHGPWVRPRSAGRFPVPLEADVER